MEIRTYFLSSKTEANASLIASLMGFNEELVNKGNICIFIIAIFSVFQRLVDVDFKKESAVLRKD